MSINLKIYVINDNSDGFNIVTAPIDSLTPQNVMAALIQHAYIPDGTTVNSFFTGVDGGEKALLIDLSEEYGNAILYAGSSAEYAYLGSVVNTYLTAYDAVKIKITINGAPLETAHGGAITGYMNFFN